MSATAMGEVLGNEVAHVECCVDGSLPKGLVWYEGWIFG